MALSHITLLALLLLVFTATASDTLPDLIRQTRCPRRCRTNRTAAIRLCRRRGCRLSRCSDFQTRFAYNCRPRVAPTLPPPVLPPPVLPPPILPPPVLPPQVAPITPGAPIIGPGIALCSVGTQRVVGLSAVVNGVEGIVIFRTYSPESGADQLREATCLADGSAGLSVLDLLGIAGGVCVPQACVVSATECVCPMDSTFCFRDAVNEALLNNCPP